MPESEMAKAILEAHPEKLVKVLVHGKERVGKCLSGDTLIPQTSGELKTIKDMVNGKEGDLFSLNRYWKITSNQPEQFIPNGKREVFLLKTRMGREIKATINHPFLTIEGWKKLSEIQIGGRIATPRKLSVFGDREVLDSKVNLIAYLLTEGTVRYREKYGENSVSFTNRSKEIMKDFIKCVKQFDNISIRMTGDGASIHMKEGYNRFEDKVDYESLRNKYKIKYYLKGFHYIVNPVILKDLHQKEELPISKISEFVGINEETLKTYFKKFGIKRKKLQGKRTKKEVLKRIRKEYNFESNFFECRKVVKKLTEKGLSPTQIAKVFPNTSLSSISQWLKNLGVQSKKMTKVENTVIKWLRSIDFKGVNAEEKEIPEIIFQLPKQKLALFLRVMFACDGWVSDRRIGYSTSSKKMAHQVQHLLLRFGIIGNIREKLLSPRYHDAYEINIIGSKQMLKFIKEIKAFNRAANKRILSKLRNKRSKPSLDRIPKDVWSQLEGIREKGGHSWQETGVSSWHKGRKPTRERLRAIAKAWNESSIYRISDSDIYWDEVVKIEPAGEEETYDLSVNPYRNFIANDIICHNSMWVVKVMWEIYEALGFSEDEAYRMAFNNLFFRPDKFLAEIDAIEKRRIEEGFQAQTVAMCMDDAGIGLGGGLYHFDRETYWELRNTWPMLGVYVTGLFLTTPVPEDITKHLSGWSFRVKIVENSDLGPKYGCQALVYPERTDALGIHRIASRVGGWRDNFTSFVPNKWYEPYDKRRIQFRREYKEWAKQTIMRREKREEQRKQWEEYKKEHGQPQKKYRGG